MAACCQLGVSSASVAMANGINANLPGDDANAHAQVLALPIPTPASPVAADIRIELQRGATTVTVTWPASAASECAAWMRELLR